RGEATKAIELFQEQNDEAGLAMGWSLLGLFHVVKCEFAASQDAWEKAAAHAHAAGEEREELEYLNWIPICVWGGPTPVEQGIRRCQEVLEEAGGDRKAMSTALFVQGKLEAMRGRFDEARGLIQRARGLLEEIGLAVWIAGPLTQMSGWVEILAGDLTGAEGAMLPGVEKLRGIGELAWLSTEAAILAEVMYQQERYEESAEFLRMADEAGGSDDVYTQGLLLGIRSKVLAGQGHRDEAEGLGREALAVADGTDFLFLQGFTRLCLGEALQISSANDAARSVLNEAIDICERKGFTVGADRARALLARES
ncbi:MAG TPA: hypothetical protein VF972_11990, partial [Actinomycetota bacterium]